MSASGEIAQKPALKAVSDFDAIVIGAGVSGLYHRAPRAESDQSGS
jgi:hypothetical protein